jgi:hypothetical protein
MDDLNTFRSRDFTVAINQITNHDNIHSEFNDILIYKLYLKFIYIYI